MDEEVKDDGPQFSDAARGELAKLSAEAKNLVLHTIHSAAELAVEGAAVILTRAHVLAVGERFAPLFSAPAPAGDVPGTSEQVAGLTAQIDALKSQLGKAATDLDLANGRVKDLEGKLAAVPTPAEELAVPVKDPLAPPETAQDAPQPAESNVPSPDAAPAS